MKLGKESIWFADRVQSAQVDGWSRCDVGLEASCEGVYVQGDIGVREGGRCCRSKRQALFKRGLKTGRYEAGQVRRSRVPHVQRFRLQKTTETSWKYVLNMAAVQNLADSSVSCRDKRASFE